MHLRTVALFACAWLAACDDPALLQDHAGQRRVLAHVDAPAAVGARLAALPKTNVVFAASPEFVAPAQQALAGRENCQLVVAGLSAAEAREAIGKRAVAAAVERTTECGAAALLLANLAARGSTVHATFPLGARWYTAANLAAGGAKVPAPGDLALEVLRMQPTPLSDAVVRVVMVIDNGSAWSRAVADDLQHAAQLQTGIVLTRQNAADASALANAIAATASDNPAALVVVTEDPTHSRPAREQALARKTKVVLIAPGRDDAATSHVGPDAETIGRAAGAAVESLVGDTARIVELGGDAAIRTGFHRALALHAR